MASAKEGLGIEEILEAVVNRVPPPQGDPDAPLRALIYDSIYDSYRGVVVNMRVFDGTIKEKDLVYFMQTDQSYELEEVGHNADEARSDRLAYCRRCWLSDG
jgi:GTP-binding protein LepA